MGRTEALKSERHGSKSQLGPFPAGWSRATYLTSLDLDFLVYKTGIKFWAWTLVLRCGHALWKFWAHSNWSLHWSDTYPILPVWLRGLAWGPSITLLPFLLPFYKNLKKLDAVRLGFDTVSPQLCLGLTSGRHIYSQFLCSADCCLCTNDSAEPPSCPAWSLTPNIAVSIHLYHYHVPNWFLLSSTLFLAWIVQKDTFLGSESLGGRSRPYTKRNM